MPTELDNPNADDAEPAWYCLRAQTKREHIAAAMLANLEGTEVFCPRLSQVKKTKVGKKRFVEAMFPGYLFAKFSLVEQYRRVIHTQGVTGMVEVGGRKPIPDAVIEHLKESIPEEVTEAPDLSIRPGAQVEVISGSLKGLNGQVLAHLPALNRVQVLLDFLGRDINIAVDQNDVLLAKEPH
ncbi:MAG: transcription termination/antitermination NusG family protein [Verrucomicrobiota bacterium]